MIGLIVLGLLWGELSADTHSLRYFVTGMTPIPGFPEFVIVGYVDGVQFVMYNSNWKGLIARKQWMVDSEGPKAWNRKLLLAQEQEDIVRRNIPRFMTRTNQTGGIHMYQMMTGCDLKDDGTVSGFTLRGWDGQDLISFDKDHMVWVTPVHWAESIKNRKDQDVVSNHLWKHFLEVECIEWLRKCLEYGQRELRVVTPIVSVTHLDYFNWLVCHVTGFYPQAIEVTLWRDGVLIDEPMSTGILPNHDKTYQIRKWIEFDPEDQAEYSCEVEHSGLEEKLVLIYDPKSHTQFPVPVGIVFGVLWIIPLSVVAVIMYKKKGRLKYDYNPTNTSDEKTSSNSSVIF